MNLRSSPTSPRHKGSSSTMPEHVLVLFTGMYLVSTGRLRRRRLFAATRTCMAAASNLTAWFWQIVDCVNNYKLTQILKNRQTANCQNSTLSREVMATKSLTARAEEFIDPDQTHVDIHKCVAGSNARAIKPGGLDEITSSIRTDGYKRVPSNKIHILFSRPLSLMWIYRFRSPWSLYVRWATVGSLSSMECTALLVYNDYRLKSILA